MPDAERSSWIAVTVAAAAVSAALVCVSVLTHGVAYGLQLADPGSAPIAALAWVDVNTERNVPTAWSAGLLLGSAAVAAALAARRTHPADGAWWPVAVVACLLGVDEWVGLHERLGGLGAALVGDALHFAWVVPGAAVAAVVGVVLVRRLRDQPAVVRHRLVVAGVVYLSGALVLETLAGFVLRDHGHAAGYLVVTAAEELLEMLGSGLLLATVVASCRRTSSRRTSSRRTSSRRTSSHRTSSRRTTAPRTTAAGTVAARDRSAEADAVADYAHAP